MKRDLASVGKKRPLHDGRRPVWNGPIPDRYYYVVRNTPIRPGSWLVLFSDIRTDVRLVANMGGGERSLIEADSPIPMTPTQGKLLAHGKVTTVRKILSESVERPDPSNPASMLPPRIVLDEEVFI